MNIFSYFQNFPIREEVVKSIEYITATSFIARLLPQLYDEHTLMTHSLHGRKPNTFKEGDLLPSGLPSFHKTEIVGE